MYGNASSPGDKTDDLIARHRTAAFGEAHGKVMDALYRNAGLLACLRRPLLRLVFLRNLHESFLIGHLFLVYFLVLFHQLVDNLAFLQAAVSHCCKHRIPGL